MSATQVSTAANSKEKVDVQIASTQAADLEVPTLVEDVPEKQGKGIRFWLVLASLLLSNFLAVLEGVSTTSLPPMQGYSSYLPVCRVHRFADHCRRSSCRPIPLGGQHLRNHQQRAAAA